MGREIEAERHHGPSSEATRISVRPIESEWVVPYNPQGGFQGFLLPGVLVLIIQQTLLIGIAMMSGTQREHGGLSTPVQYVGGHYVSVMRLLVGRAICYFTLYSVTSLFTLVVAPWLFGLPQLTDFTTYVLLFLPMILAMIFFSLGCSLLTRHREKAMILWVFTSVPFLFLTGLSWPLSAIPGPLRALGYLIPSTPGVQAFVAVSTYGCTALRHPTAVPHAVGTGSGLLSDHVLRLRSRAAPLLARSLVVSNVRGPKHLCFGPRTFYTTKIRLFVLKHHTVAQLRSSSLRREKQEAVVK